MAVVLHAALILGMPAELVAELDVQPVRGSLRINLVAPEREAAAPVAEPISETAAAKLPEPSPVVEPKREPAPEPPTPVASPPVPEARPEEALAIETTPAVAPPAPPPSPDPAEPPSQAPPTAPAEPLADPLAFEPLPDPEPDPAPTGAAALINRSLAMARSQTDLAGIRPSRQDPALRRKHITSRTRDPTYAAYMDSWVKKVERIGALNYAEGSGDTRLTGTLRLDVAIRPDGSIAAIELLRSSGNKQVDEAAKRIVRLGEPYAPLPPEIRAETDVLHITRVWRFSDGNLWGNGR